MIKNKKKKWKRSDYKETMCFFTSLDRERNQWV